jgi:hypothetical protein
MATELHDSDLFSYFVLLAAEVVSDGQVGARAWDALPLELVEAVCARVVARDDLDSLQTSVLSAYNEKNQHPSGKVALI